MASEINIKLKRIIKAKEAVLQMEVVTVDKLPRYLLANQREYVRKFEGILASAGNFDRLDIIINSQGGTVKSGIGLMGGIVSCLHRKWRKWEQHVRILIDRDCNSAATLLLGICAPVYITPGGKIYIHNPIHEVWQGRGKDWQRISVSPASKQSYSALERTYKFRIKNMSKKKWNKKQVREWMEEGKWFTGEQAVEAGFADGIMSRAEFEKGVN